MYSITMGFSRQYNDDPRLLPSGKSVKYHVEAWLLQPMKHYIITLPGLMMYYIVYVFILLFSGVPA